VFGFPKNVQNILYAIQYAGASGNKICNIPGPARFLFFAPLSGKQKTTGSRDNPRELSFIYYRLVKDLTFPKNLCFKGVEIEINYSKNDMHV
jgi:hypothetical protein